MTRTSVSYGSHVGSQSGYFDLQKLHEMTMNDVLYDLATYEVIETGRYFAG